ncbi:DUF3558 domain-containing protein [Mycobacterium sp.]|jgi:hypothetical protein|uniref:DUF3558 domain-containing protein n=1 Tax=Mycobacterium sp. TaxID=1785 RepID=UPI002D33EB01|nr:DUF3558 domain-containing protein [Mycobacterium sp.]HZA12103.1 DUF3558 domain-containing protein [Mycobacterium sp.]
MATKLRLLAALGALVTAVVVGWQSAPPAAVTRTGAVALRYTAMPMETPTTTIKWPVIEFTNQRPFAPCEDIPIGAIHQLGLDFTPPEPEEGLRCHYDAANYQMSIEPIVWRTYEQTIPVDALEATINGHRAAQYWVMKPTDWNNRWWFSCMVTFKTSYGVIQQSLFYSPIYSNPDVDCLAENFKRAQQLAPYYIF